MSIERDLTASEALYSFISWLTTREEEITLSKFHEPSKVAELIGKFCTINNLPDPGSSWKYIKVNIPEEVNE